MEAMTVVQQHDPVKSAPSSAESEGCGQFIDVQHFKRNVNDVLRSMCDRMKQVEVVSESNCKNPSYTGGNSQGI